MDSRLCHVARHEIDTPHTYSYDNRASRDLSRPSAERENSNTLSIIFVNLAVRVFNFQIYAMGLY
jgi:hypothetical protein